MLLETLNFDLPEELIAQDPAEPRDAARLFVYNRRDRSIAHHTVRELPTILPRPTLFVANDTRVRKSRFEATTSSGKTCEVLVTEQVSGGSYECLVRGRGVKPGDKLLLKTGETISIADTHTEADFTSYIIDFSAVGDPEAYFASHGATPLPPYITHSHAPDERYQTVFSQGVGSAAAPTAGLHFTPELIQTLSESGSEWETVTLHVGMGTFQPLRNETVERNVLHEEKTRVREDAADHIAQAREKGTPITAIGTTSTRTLESHFEHGVITAGEKPTSLFIYPGYQFQCVDQLLTNFHLPKSSLLLLVAALIAEEPGTHRGILSPEEAVAELQRLYREAIAHRYRFFSFGDAMLIL